MYKRHVLGKRGEQIAKSYFEQHYFEIIEQNFRSGKSEVDLIVKQDNLLVFVEVKTRSSEKFAFPEDAVTQNQIDRILRAAEDFVFKTNWKGQIRFDIISVLINGRKTELRHFKDALY